MPPLGAYVIRPELPPHLAELDREAAESGLELDFEQRLELPDAGDPIVVRVYVGRDSVGRAVHAVRAATPFGIVLAAGPLRTDDVRRREATEFVPALATDQDGHPIAYHSLTDLTGTGAIDLVLRSEAGRLEVWRLGPRAAIEYPIVLDVRATRAADLDGDGRVDLLGEVPIAADDPIQPRLEDWATFAAGSFTHRSEPARALHERAAAERARPPRGETPEARARRVLERAWHQILAGQDPEEILDKLDDETPSGKLRTSFRDHRRRIERIGK